MQGKERKSKEYYLEGKCSTAKKVKKNRHNDSKTPNSHSTSHNHHKYQKEIAFEEQATSKKHPLTVKQMKMMIRCMQEYCSLQNNTCQEISQKYQLTAKIFHHLQENYKIIGNQRQVRKNQRLLQQLTPHVDLQCPFCKQLGHPCDDYQIETLDNSLKEEIDRLQNHLLLEFKRGQQLELMIQGKEQYENRKNQLENLKKVEKIQTQILNQLEEQFNKEELSKLFSLQSKVSLQLEDQ